MFLVIKWLKIHLNKQTQPKKEDQFNFELIL